MTALALAVALAAGYLLGRLRPWLRLGDWAADQIRHTGAWARGRHSRQAAVLLAHALTAPRTSWRIIRTPAAARQEPAPVRDPNWAATRATRTDQGDTE
ncbi:hypothetical protein [Streptomyces fulvorobeus]|uniref:Uncharacterized protein n=1 Tax=Streptomyces fulvorobeus TaxID=284028 RepID=A0A7J0CI46_9ACTN|nr:hypothetical protein [Streptomyces fulvorobeus]NYE44874.1 hypothetical protein [Streptomyces fulvorobeus]GFN01407.1 hypothetical protein Sfulv_62170 [Streptomyces fulvorobeus]